MLKNDKIKLRALEPEDIHILYKWENDPENWPVSSTMAPYSEFVLNQYLENAHLDIYAAGQLRLVIEDVVTGEDVGFVDLFEFDPLHLKAGVGILIGDEVFKQQGYATMALELIKEYAIKYLRLHQVYCHIDEANTKSIELFQKVGFKEMATLKDWKNIGGKWCDVKVYHFLNDEV